MALPNLSNSIYVAQLRHIQSIHESPERRNPDTLVRHFIPIFARLRTSWLGREELSQLQADPFYYYLLARTRYYDQVLNEAVADGVRKIVSVGSGSDTRAYRFQHLLHSNGVSVLECDQSEAIHVKQRIAKRKWRFDHVEYLAIDLNDDAWPELESRLGTPSGPKTLVLMEGVSPYVDDRSFRSFLGLLSTRLSVGSQVAYDFKIRGIKEAFGCTGRTEVPFRLSPASEEIAAFHGALGLRLGHLELSSDLCVRLLPALSEQTSTWFNEDALVRLQVDGA